MDTTVLHEDRYGLRRVLTWEEGSGFALHEWDGMTPEKWTHCDDHRFIAAEDTAGLDEDALIAWLATNASAVIASRSVDTIDGWHEIPIHVEPSIWWEDITGSFTVEELVSDIAQAGGPPAWLRECQGNMSPEPMLGARPMDVPDQEGLANLIQTWLNNNGGE